MAWSILRRCWAGPKLDQGEGDTPGDDVMSSSLLKTMPGGVMVGFYPPWGGDQDTILEFRGMKPMKDGVRMYPRGANISSRFGWATWTTQQEAL